MQLARRGFITGIIAACAGPAIIRTPGLIMPIKPHIDTRLEDLVHLAVMERASRAEWYLIHARGMTMLGLAAIRTEGAAVSFIPAEEFYLPCPRRT